MATVGTYLNFVRETEEAFGFYKTVFGGDYVGEINRLGDVPPQEGQPPLAEGDQDLIMHVAIRTVGDHLLHGTDVPESMGSSVNKGNNVSIMLQPDTREDVDRLFASLSEGGKVEMPPTDMFWGSYWGSCIDQFGIQWMFNYDPTA